MRSLLLMCGLCAFGPLTRHSISHFLYTPRANVSSRYAGADLARITRVDKKLSSYPYNIVGVLRVVKRGKPKDATGFLIGEDIVLTAAHHLIPKEGENIRAQPMEFIWKCNEGQGYSMVCTDFSIHPQWYVEEEKGKPKFNPYYDIAVIKYAICGA